MPGRAKLVLVEAKLMLRDPTALFFVVALPVVLLVIFDFITTEQAADEADRASLKMYVPAIALSLALVMIALNLLPTNLATYRERGILRRLSVSPAHPSRVLIAQLAVNFVTSVISTVVVVTVADLAFDMAPPRQVPAFVLMFVLSAWALFAIGLLIAALAPNGRTATAVGLSVLFPSLFLGGGFVPLEDLPDPIRRIGEYTPLGAAMTGFRDAWAGNWPDARFLIVPAVIGLVGTVLAARVFRWE
ncbi:ABC transporter permease [Nocardia takedensis]|uniref:ABC transporter permease n=1 Tax=Nocardia takedensis TaxID=259390 RepID=UPI0002F80617|nr:ABC transporter permease [Nocardia takedensis]